MLLTVCVVFLLCTLPITIYLSDTDSFESAYGCCFSSYVLWPIFNMLLYLNNTTNFVLYCVSGKKFRQQLRAMFSCRPNTIDAHPWWKCSQIKLELTEITRICNSRMRRLRRATWFVFVCRSEYPVRLSP